MLGSPTVDADSFRRALGRFGSGVTVVTVRGPDGADHGLTASAFSSLSLDPPLVMLAIRGASALHPLLVAAPGFGVSLLGEGQVSLSDRFAGRQLAADGSYGPWPTDRNKLEGVPHSRGAASGAMLLAGALAVLDCTKHAVHDGGDHSIFVGRVEAVRLLPAEQPQRPLLYFAGAYRQLGRDGALDAEQALRVPDWFD